MSKNMKLPAMIIVLLLTGTAAWALTPHKEYASMKIKDCNTCHAGSGVQETHTTFWLQQHRFYSEKHPNNCGDCHQLSWCSDCHYGGGLTPEFYKSNFGPDYMPKSHRSDFRELHPIRALDDPRSCYRCHDAVEFCNDCHKKFNQTGLLFESHRKRFFDIPLTAGGPTHAIFNTAQCPTCHPNSLVPSHVWSSDHAREARTKLATCQTCHPDGDVCMTCHSAVSGLRVNPHPRGWNNISGRLQSASNNRSCIKCHNF